MADSGVLTEKTDEGSKPKSYISRAPIRRLMKNEGALLVSNEAISLMIEKLQQEAKRVVRNAIKVVQSEKRVRLTAEDIKNGIVLP